MGGRKEENVIPICKCQYHCYCFQTELFSDHKPFSEEDVKIVYFKSYVIYSYTNFLMNLRFCNDQFKQNGQKFYKNL